MGANAQTTVPLFVANTVLTAATQNISAATGVPVFATTVTRDAAFGGANKALALGQLCYLEATNVVQYYTGSAWATVGPTQSVGLTFITGAAFTTATSFSLPASTFTTTYRNYRLIVNITATTADSTLTMRMRAAGTDSTGAAYGTMMTGVTSTGTATNSTGNDQTSWAVGESDSGIPAYSLVLDVMSPQVATFTMCEGAYATVSVAGTSALGRSGSLLLNSSTQFDSLSFISSTASSITGVYRVYGYSES